MSLAPQLAGLFSGMPAMDKLHHDFYEALDRLSTASDQEFGEGYGRFVKQVEDLFRKEEQWMEDIRFPGFKTHREQHAKVLSALHNVHSRVMAEDIELGREVVANLFPQWLAFHMETMDSNLALAMQLAKISHKAPVGS